ncbi:MAG: septal ring lytic transglycosylase RlpA family protein, partial [Bdellovibrionales bacterium]
GKMTANGEIFNKGDLTAAHRTLQLPSIIRVTNLQNGRSVIVRVNDRGPFAHNRVLDLSEKAATLLGFKNQGITKIKLEVLPEESRMVAQATKQGRDTTGVEVALNRHRTPTIKPTPLAQESEGIQIFGGPKYYIQAGAFTQEENARRFSQLLSGISNTNVISTPSTGGVTLYKVRLGPVRSQHEANTLLAAVETRSRSNAIIIKE